MKNVYLMTLILLFISGCATRTNIQDLRVEQPNRLIDFTPSNYKGPPPILFANKGIYQNGTLCRYLIDSNVRAIRFSYVIENLNNTNKAISVFRQSPEYIEWNSEIESPRSESYYQYASQKMERLKQNLKEEIVSNSMPAYRESIKSYTDDSGVLVILSGDQWSDYVSYCPELFSPESYVINSMNGFF